MEYELGASGKAYSDWAAKMAVGLGTGVPWVMCKQDDAPDPIVSILCLLFFNHVFLTFSCHVPCPILMAVIMFNLFFFSGVASEQCVVYLLLMVEMNYYFSLHMAQLYSSLDPSVRVSLFYSFWTFSFVNHILMTMFLLSIIIAPI